MYKNTEKLEILWELSKCDREKWSEQMLLEKMVQLDLFDTALTQTLNL